MNYTAADFTSKQEVRWCPGCGDYAVLATLQRVLPKLNIMPHEVVFISGIGCASRLPYYMNTYGFHTIHGRAPAVATGLKLMRPELSVWIITGDGDGLSIGLGHLMHIMRRNIDVNILLLNNGVYGLTKGQYSPTSTKGQITSTSPTGNRDNPLNPLSMAIAAGCGFIGRAFDVDAPNLSQVLLAAAKHPGTSFVEIWQNCNIFNDGAFKEITNKNNRAENILYLKNEEPLLFGEQQEKTLILQDLKLQVANKEDVSKEQLLVHNSQKPSLLPNLLVELAYPDLPVAMGVLQDYHLPAYPGVMESNYKQPSYTDLVKILHNEQIWEIK